MKLGPAKYVVKLGLRRARSAEFCAAAQYSAVRRSASPESPSAKDRAMVRISQRVIVIDIAGRRV
jgi:hypothetical protein